MDWLILLEIILLLMIIIPLVYTVLYWAKYKDNFDAKFSVVVWTVIILALMVFTAWWTFCGAVNLPAEYLCAVDTVDETEELLMRYENLTESFGSIGQGLESMELKVDLKKSIVQKNRYKRDIMSWLNNPFSPYRDVLLSGLPDNWKDL